MRTLRNQPRRRCTGAHADAYRPHRDRLLRPRRTVEFYRATYGFEVFHTEVNEEQGVREAMLRINGTDDGGASYLQLLEPVREDSTVAKWLAKNGEGVHHIAFGTADVDADADSDPRQGRPGPLRRAPHAAPWTPGSPSCTPRTATGCSPNWSPRAAPRTTSSGLTGRNGPLTAAFRPGRVAARPGRASASRREAPGWGLGPRSADDLTPFPDGPGGSVHSTTTRGRMGPRSAGLRPLRG